MSPRVAELAVGNDPRGASAARRLVRDELAAAGLDALVDDVALAVTELITNAQLHTRAGAEVRLVVQPPGVRLEVVDYSTESPLTAAEHASTMTGRGLSIVEQLADRWGFDLLAAGKIVWAEFGGGLEIGGGPTSRLARPDTARNAVAGSGNAVVAVRLRGLPVRLVLAGTAYIDDLVREFQLLDAARLPATQRFRDMIEITFEEVSPAAITAAANRARAAGESVVDLELGLTPAMAVRLRQMSEVLDQATELVRRGLLLTPLPTSEEVAFRRWMISEMVRQLSGAEPFDCPFDSELTEIDESTVVDDLRVREARFRSLIEVAELDVWRTDAQGRVTTDMPEWQSHTGQESVLGEDWLQGVHPDHRDRVRATWTTAVESGSSYECEYPIVGVGGATRWIVARGAPVHEGGEIREWIGTTVDVTAQREARLEVAMQGRVVEALYDSVRTLSTTLELDDVLRRLVEVTTDLTGADFGAFFFNRVDAAGEAYQLVTLHGATMDDFAFGMPRNTKIFAPTFGGEDVVRFEDVTRQPQYGQNPPHRGMPEGHLPVRSYLAVPVIDRAGGVHGGLFFGHAQPGRFTKRHEDLVASIAAQASVAIDNALLYDAERAARSSAEVANRRSQILADAMERLGVSLELSPTAQALADLVVPELADWAVVSLRGPRGEDHPFVRAGSAPADIDAVPAHRVELRMQDGTSGSFVAGCADGELDDDARVLIDQIAGRAVVALDNALLYGRQRTASLALQKTLLPNDEPPLPGWSYARRYEPAGAGEIGGDFHDIVLPEDGRAVFVVGDVQGKGLNAAASMGQVRAAVRAYSMLGGDPGAVLRDLGRVWEREGDVLVTCLHLVVDLSTGTGLAATAGHLPPLRFGGSSAPTYLTMRPGPPIGVMPTVYAETDVSLAPGEGLVLFTDGLVEHRGHDIDDGLDRLASVVAEHQDEPLDALADAVLREVLADVHDDDVALVLLRRDR